MDGTLNLGNDMKKETKLHNKAIECIDVVEDGK